MCQSIQWQLSFHITCVLSVLVSVSMDVVVNPYTCCRLAGFTGIFVVGTSCVYGRGYVGWPAFSTASLTASSVRCMLHCLKLHVLYHVGFHSCIMMPARTKTASLSLRAGCFIGAGVQAWGLSLARTPVSTCVIPWLAFLNHCRWRDPFKVYQPAEHALRGFPTH